jgi:AAA family ATP:ADP antiporter
MSNTNLPSANPATGLRRLVDFRPGEGRLVAWAFVYLFAVFSSNYVIRPIRDEIGLAGGVSNLSWLFTGTQVAMMAVNPAFALLFSSGTANVWVAGAFFIWPSVFNLFVVSVFWAFMVDIFTSEHGKRLFSFIAAVATLGGICGAANTASAVKSVGVPSLLICAAVLIEAGVFAARRLGRLGQAAETAPVEQPTPAGDRSIGGSVIAGFTHAWHDPYLLQISLYMLLYTIRQRSFIFKQFTIDGRLVISSNLSNQWVL